MQILQALNLEIDKTTALHNGACHDFDLSLIRLMEPFQKLITFRRDKSSRKLNIRILMIKFLLLTNCF